VLGFDLDHVEGRVEAEHGVPVVGGDPRRRGRARSAVATDEGDHREVIPAMWSLRSFLDVDPAPIAGSML
jgi:hypothetical protein